MQCWNIIFVDKVVNNGIAKELLCLDKALFLRLLFSLDTLTMYQGQTNARKDTLVVFVSQFAQNNSVGFISHGL